MNLDLAEQISEVVDDPIKRNDPHTLLKMLLLVEESNKDNTWCVTADSLNKPLCNRFHMTYNEADDYRKLLLAADYQMVQVWNKTQ